MARYIKLTETDNIIVAVEPITLGESVAEVTARERIPRGHKMALQAIANGTPIVKYGQIIGFSTRDIEPGQWVHEHNVTMQSFERGYASGEEARPTRYVEPEKRHSFNGFRRPSGRFGTRNYIAVLTSVNCSATASRFIADEINRSGILDQFPNVDGVISLVHGTGCGLDIHGEAYELLKRTQWGVAKNPNVGGVLMVGLGCEAFQIPRWMDAYS